MRFYPRCLRFLLLDLAILGIYNTDFLYGCFYMRVVTVLNKIDYIEGKFAIRYVIKQDQRFVIKKEHFRSYQQAEKEIARLQARKIGATLED